MRRNAASAVLILAALVSLGPAGVARADEEFEDYQAESDLPAPPPTATRANAVLAGRFGIGAHHVLAGESGVAFRYFIDESVAGEIVLRPTLQNLGRDPAFSLLAAARAESVFLPAADGFVGVFGGGGVVLVGDVVMLLEAGLKGEYLLWQDMSVFAEVGLSARVAFGDSTTLDFGGGGGPFGAAGFTVWFP